MRPFQAKNDYFTIKSIVESETQPITALAADVPYELELLLRIGALDENELREANARGHAAAFQRPVGVTA